MRETLLASVRSRTTRATNGDHAAVLEDDAVDEAEALLALDLVNPVTGAYVDLEILHAVGSMVWQRALANGVWADLKGAVEILVPVYDADPERVPPELRDHYARHGPRPRRTTQRRATTRPAPAVCTSYGVLLLRRYERTGEPEALAAGTTLFRWALDGVPPGDPGRRPCLEDLFHAVEIQAKLGDDAAAREAVELARTLVTLPDDGNRPPDTDVLDALRRHAEHTGDVDALRVAVMAGERALKQTGADASERASLCMTLAMAVGALAAHTGDVSDLRRAAGLGEEAVRSTRTGDPDRGHCGWPDRSLHRDDGTIDALSPRTPALTAQRLLGLPPGIERNR